MILQLGSTGPLVTELKRRLNARGASLTPANVNFGHATMAAVQVFQRAAGLTDDGAVDTNSDHGTWAALLTVIAAEHADPLGIAEVILAQARHFVGLTEIAPNRRWDDLSTPGTDPRAEELRQALLAVGWQPSWAYCAAFGEAVLRRAYAALNMTVAGARMAKILTPGAVNSFDNARAAGLTSRTPVPGALVCWQHGDSDQGHEGIFVRLRGRIMLTIEANTNSGGSREGDGIYEKESRVLDFTRGAGLNLLGFIPPLLS